MKSTVSGIIDPTKYSGGAVLEALPAMTLKRLPSMPPNTTPPERLCVYCNSPIISERINDKRTVYCSSTCASAARRPPRTEAYWPYIQALTTGTIGALNELRVSCDLLYRGFHVFRALSPACPCDLVAYKTPESIIRIEVRTVPRQLDGTIPTRANPKDEGRYDVYAFVTHDGEIVYVPDL